MKTKQLLEAEKATVAFAFGRFNPAHQGHIEVWRAVEQAGQKWFIGTNPSTLGPNDPLTFEQKSAWMAEIYPPIQGHIVPQTSVLTLAAYIFKKLRNNESASIAYVTDETDWAWSGKLLNQYNGQEGAHGYYKFAQIIHVPSPRVSSATALRDAARADDRVAFYHASGTDPKAKVAGLTYFDTVKQACEKYPLPVKKSKKIKEDEQGETGHETGNQLIPWPTGTTKVHVSDVYDWYKLGQVISDLDDADPKQFGQGQPQTVIAFGSEEEESKLLPLLKRLGLKVDDIDPKGSDIDEAYHAGALYDYLKNTKQDMSEEKQRLDAKCWTGYKKQGTKMKGNTRVNNCVKESALDEKSVSKAQFRTMAAVANNPEFAKKVGISQAVGKEFHSADKNTNYKKLPKKVDEILDPTSMSANVLRYLGRKTAAAFPWIATGAVGGALAYSGLLAPIMASVGGVGTALAGLSTEVMAYGAVGGMAATPSLIQIVKDLFAADENSIQAGIKRWVEKHVGDENDVQEFINLHAQSAYLKQPMFRWRAEEWKTKMKPDEAEAYLEKHNKGWIDAEKQKVIDAEKAKAEKEKAEKVDAEKANVKPGVKPGFKPPVKPATESLDADQKRAGQVGSRDKAKQIGQVLAKPTKQHPYKGRLVGEAEEQIDEIDRRGFLKGLGAGAAAVAGAGLPTLAQAKGPGYWANYAGKLITDKLGSGLKFNPFGGQAPGTITIQSGEREVSGIEFISTNVYDLVTKYCELTDCYNAKQAIDNATSEAIKISKADAFLYKPGYSRQFVLAYRASLDDSVYEWKKAGRPTQAQQQPQKQEQPAQQSTQQQPAQQEIKLNLKLNRQVGDIITVKGGVADGKKAKVTQILGPNKEGTGNKGLGIVVESVNQGVAEDTNGEYNDEAGMAKSNLLTTARAVAGLLKTIQDNDNLPEWGQEKIAKAEMMLVSIWDYLQSQKEQGIDPKVEGVTEADIDFGPEWDEIVKRVGQRAKQGPLKTVWDEKKRVYRNVPVNDPDQPSKEVDEASLATMRDYFAGNDDARDPTKIAQMRDFFNKNKLPGSNVKDKRFASRQAYELWLKQNGLRDLSSK